MIYVAQTNAIYRWTMTFSQKCTNICLRGAYVDSSNHLRPSVSIKWQLNSIGLIFCIHNKRRQQQVTLKFMLDLNVKPLQH